MAALGYQSTPGYPPAGPYPPQAPGYQPGGFQPGGYPQAGSAFPTPVDPYQPSGGAYPPQGGAYPPAAGAYSPTTGAYPTAGGAAPPPPSGGYPAGPTAPVGPTADPVAAWQPQAGMTYQGSDVAVDFMPEDHVGQEPTAPPMGPPPAFTGYEVGQLWRRSSVNIEFTITLS